MKLSHTVTLLLIDDRPGPVKATKQLFSFHISPAVIFALIVNLAAIGLVVRDVAATVQALASEVEQDWSAGIFAIVTVIFPIRAYATG